MLKTANKFKLRPLGFPEKSTDLHTCFIFLLFFNDEKMYRVF